MAAPLTAEDLYRFRWIDHVRLSPDGERVAYQVGWADASSRQNRSRIVVRRLLDPEPIGATGGAQRDHSPEWAPDGRKLAFLSKSGAADQLFVLDITTGGTAQQLSAVPEGASAPKWSPDGSRVAFIGTVQSDPEAVVDDPRPPEGREQLRRPPVARVVRRLDYKHDGLGYVDGRYHHLFVVSVSGGEAKQLTSGAWDVTDFDWSPDGTRLVVAGNAEPGSDLQRELNLYLVDLGGTRVRLGGGFYLSSPIWSPQGDHIAFIAPNGLDVGLLERLWVVPLSGGGPHCLTASFDLAVTDSVINDMRAGHATRIRWDAEGPRIDVLASVPGAPAVPGGHGIGRLRPEPARLRRLRGAFPGRGRARSGRQGLHRHNELARPGHRAHRLQRCQASGGGRRLVWRLHDQLDHRPHGSLRRRGGNAFDIQPGERVLAARHRAMGHAPDGATAVAGPRRAVAQVTDPIRAEHAHPAAADRGRDGPSLRDVAVGGAVWCDATVGQDGRARPLSGGIARSLTQRTARQARRAPAPDWGLVRALPRHRPSGSSRP